MGSQWTVRQASTTRGKKITAQYMFYVLRHLCCVFFCKLNICYVGYYCKSNIWNWEQHNYHPVSVNLQLKHPFNETFSSNRSSHISPFVTNTLHIYTVVLESGSWEANPSERKVLSSNVLHIKRDTFQCSSDSAQINNRKLVWHSESFDEKKTFFKPS